MGNGPLDSAGVSATFPGPATDNNMPGPPEVTPARIDERRINFRAQGRKHVLSPASCQPGRVVRTAPKRWS